MQTNVNKFKQIQNKCKRIQTNTNKQTNKQTNKKIQNQPQPDQLPTPNYCTCCQSHKSSQILATTGTQF